jgi:large subunit ribosomal protein L7/L12
VRLEGFDPARKINATKAMREMSNLGLKEARDLVEGPPRALKEGLELAEAEKLRDHLTAVGLKVALVPSAAVAG